MHELAKGGTNTTATWGATRNPWDADRIPGGSSGGTAAAIAARLVPAGLGTDTLGSTRIPAAMCGIAALRPSIVPGSLYQGPGIVPDVPPLDTAGPMGRTMGDVSLMHTVMTGKAVPTRSLAGARLGVPSQHYWEHLDPEVHRVARDALDRLRDAGAVLVDVDVRSILDAHGVYFTLCDVPAEFGKWLATRLPSVSLSHVINTLRAEPVREWWLGSQPSAEAIRVSLARRDALIAAYSALFRRCDIAALAYPTCITPAFPIREEGDAATDAINVAGNTIRESLVTIRNTGATAVFKAPGISLPAGVSSAGLPVGLDLDGMTGGDEALLALGVSVERVLGTLPSPMGRAR
jgi:Asp-tRNA(Asn)/Glu-tRNA(Gln) amidotransferase A subunit family amidase